MVKCSIIYGYDYTNSTTAAAALERIPGGIRVTIVRSKFDEKHKASGE